MAKKNNNKVPTKNVKKRFHPKNSYKFKKFYNCNKFGHTTKFCREPKKKNVGQGSGSKEFSFVVKESLMVSPFDEWWVDSRGIRHITSTKSNMVEFKEKGDGVEKLFMGSSCFEKGQLSFHSHPVAI
ncbi:hypothetical protein AMTR_s00007p00253260 [Amborella trichopoda]|uniref:CCHC-type domain-containing protein n=1 Tax=Amborella trichopoda TaxID=13333 RepID=W1PCX1_AMBTC|nr:hypothetical protein AMTR_s00007p00253260 [Amborella trichopoda]